MRPIVGTHNGTQSLNSAATKRVHDDTCSDRLFNSRKAIGQISVGGRVRYDELKPGAKQASRKIYGQPSHRGSKTDMQPR